MIKCVVDLSNCELLAVGHEEVCQVILDYCGAPGVEMLESPIGDSSILNANYSVLVDGERHHVWVSPNAVAASPDPLTNDLPQWSEENHWDIKKLS